MRTSREIQEFADNVQRAIEKPGDMCPLCWRTGRAFENHHCVFRSDGGSDRHTNILPICRTCHATISFGDGKEARPLEAACLAHRLANHGVMFVYRERHSGHGLIRSLAERWRASELSAREADKVMRDAGLRIFFEKMRELHDFGSRRDVA